MTTLMDRTAAIPRTSSITMRLRQLYNTVRLWQLRARSRRQLAQLDARQLADIAISPSERLHELDKPFWRK